MRPMTHARLERLYLAGLTVHNLEELIWLPAWTDRLRSFKPRISRAGFGCAVTVLTLLAYALVPLSRLAGPRSRLAHLKAAYVNAVIANAFLPHLAASLTLRRYMPGLATGLLLNLPLGTALIRRELAEGLIEAPRLRRATLLFSLGLLALLPLLFRLGERLWGEQAEDADQPDWLVL